MRKLLKTFLRFLVLSAKSSFYLLLLIKESNWRLYDKLNSKEHPNRTLKILGNGNSLNEVLSQLDSNVDYMVLNRHVLHESYSAIRPRYYVLADPYFFIKEEGLECLRKINNSTDWKMTLFLPNNTSGVENQMFSNMNIKIQRFNGTPFVGFDCLRLFFYKHNICMPMVQNVLVACIYIAICLKYKEIEMYGVEHSWTKSLFVGADNIVYQHDPHFYDKKEVKPVVMDKSPFDGFYKFHEILRDYAQMFESYQQLRRYADSKGCHVVNMTRGSFIDAFERGGYYD